MLILLNMLMRVMRVVCSHHPPPGHTGERLANGVDASQKEGEGKQRKEEVPDLYVLHSSAQRDLTCDLATFRKRWRSQLGFHRPSQPNSIRPESCDAVVYSGVLRV